MPTDNLEFFWDLSSDTALTNLQTNLGGLTQTEAQKRLRVYGYNTLKQKKRNDSLALLLAQFKSPIILLLIFAAGLSFSLGDQSAFDAIAGVLARADAVQAKLAELDGRVDAAAQKRRAELKRQLTAEKGDLDSAKDKLTGILGESQSLGGGLAYAMVSKVTDRFYDLVVQSEVGMVDVAWGLKDERTSAVSKLINQQKLELKSVEDDFHSLLEEEK